MSQEYGKNKNQLFSLPSEHTNCSKCGGRLLIKSGQHGAFLGCEHYPKCDFVKTLKAQHETTLVKLLPEKHCPLCYSELALRQGRYGMFIGCYHYPTCNYVAHLNPPEDPFLDVDSSTDDLNACTQTGSAIVCPVCKTGHIVKRLSRFGKAFWGCSDYPSCKFIVNDPPSNQSCPECGFGLLLEKKSSHGVAYKCASKRCQYKS